MRYRSERPTVYAREGVLRWARRAGARARRCGVAGATGVFTDALRLPIRKGAAGGLFCGAHLGDGQAVFPSPRRPAVWRVAVSGRARLATGAPERGRRARTGHGRGGGDRLPAAVRVCVGRRRAGAGRHCGRRAQRRRRRRERAVRQRPHPALSPPSRAAGLGARAACARGCPCRAALGMCGSLSCGGDSEGSAPHCAPLGGRRPRRAWPGMRCGALQAVRRCRSMAR